MKKTRKIRFLRKNGGILMAAAVFVTTGCNQDAPPRIGDGHENTNAHGGGYVHHRTFFPTPGVSHHSSTPAAAGVAASASADGASAASPGSSSVSRGGFGSTASAHSTGASS